MKNLEGLGLTDGESRVYLALLRVGSATVGTVIKEAHVSNSKVYDILDRLNRKGLVGITRANERYHFQAKDPSNLRHLLSLKEHELRAEKKQLETLLPELCSIYERTEAPQEAEVLQGVQGIRSFTESILARLKSGDTFYILGAPREASEALGEYFNDWHERRSAKGVKCRILFNESARAQAEMRRRTPLTQVRLMPQDIITPAVTDIAKDYVAHLIFGARPVCFVMRNAAVAKSYLSYFKLLWQMGR